MATFGKQKISFTKEREVDSSVSPQEARFKEREATSDEQAVADKNILNLVLAEKKNEEVLNIAAAIGEDLTEVYIPIPTRDLSDEVTAVRRALVSKYNLESEGGTIIRFPLFKQIVDNAVKSQTSVIEKLMFGGQGEAIPFAEQIHEIKIGSLMNIFSGAANITDFIDNRAENPIDQKENERRLLLTLGVAFLSFQLQKQFHKLSPMFTAKDDIVDIEDFEIPTEASEAVKKAAAKKARLIRILQRVAEAVVLFALIHQLSRRQTQSLYNQVIPPEVDPGLKQEFETKLLGLYDAPTDELRALTTESDNPDQTIMEYALRYIEIHPEVNFHAWIIYATASVRQLNLASVIHSLEGTTQAGELYRPPSFTVEHQIVISDNPVPRTTVGALNTATTVGGIRTEVEIPTITKYLPKLQGNKTLGVNIMDYINETSNYADASGDTSNYFMNLLHNNKYTPELVCCLVNYLVKGDIDETLDFLRNLRDMLNVMARGITFDYGRLFEDIVNGLFRDFKNKILTYAFTELSKFFEARKEDILDFAEKIMGNNKFLIFCTPLQDIVAAILNIMESFQALLESVLEELINQLLSFEIKNTKDGLVSLQGTNRYRNIINILDALIASIEIGRLCNFERLAPTDIHPDLLPIIDQQSEQPRILLSDSITRFKEFRNKIRQDTGFTDLSVGEFQDPEDPALRGAVSLDREFNGESTIETIIKFSDKCQAFKEQLNSLDVRTLNA